MVIPILSFVKRVNFGTILLLYSFSTIVKGMDFGTTLLLYPFLSIVKGVDTTLLCFSCFSTVKDIDQAWGNLTL